MSDTMGASREPVFSSSSSSSSAEKKGAITGNGPVGGASTGSPAAPTEATSSNYQRERSRYNVSTGSGFNPPPKEEESKNVSNEQDPKTSAGIAPDKMRTDASGTTPGPGANGNGGETGIKGTLAGIHGAGESIRGTVGTAIDSFFNDQEGVSKNQAIVRDGEWEVKTGQFSKSTKEREKLGRNR